MKFGIIGGGSWATALVKILTDNKIPVNWWIRNRKMIEQISQRKHNPHYLSSVYFETELLYMDDNLQAVISNSDTLVVCIPSSFVLMHFEILPKNAFLGKNVVSAIKGVLPGTNLLLNEYLAKHFHLPVSSYFNIMGPCHAEEVAAEKLSYLTFSGEDVAMAETIAANFKTYYLNTVISHDIWGTQYAAVLKNIYAVGAGIAHGLEYGDNFLSVYIANAADEMVHFLRKVMEHKSAPDTDKINYTNSVYLGDLLVTCYSLFSRNRTFGNMIGKGYTVKVAQLELNMVAEGYPASKGLFEINKIIKADMLIAKTIYEILWEEMPADEGFVNIEQALR